jgi:hypothetical protein
MTEPGESLEAIAHALVARIFDLLHECRAVLPKLEMPHVRPESAGARAERMLYVARCSARSRPGCAHDGGSGHGLAAVEPTARASGGRRFRAQQREWPGESLIFRYGSD